MFVAAKGACSSALSSHCNSPLQSVRSPVHLPLKYLSPYPSRCCDPAHLSTPAAQQVASDQQQPAAAAAVQPTEWFQKTITLPQHKRGCHVITRKILSELPEVTEYEVGLANLFILHTSASLTINENASPDVPLDLNDALDRLAPEGNHYRHLDEGYDDMPAHVKSSLMGLSLMLPIAKGRFALGTWQGIYLNEHRNHGGLRSIVVTIQGQKRADGRKYSPYR